MDDSAGMRAGQGVGDRDGKGEELIERKATLR